MLSSIGENVTGKSNVKYGNAKRPWLIFTMSAFKKITINFMIGAAIQRRFEWMHFSDTLTNKLPLISAVCLPLSLYMAQPASHIYTLSDTSTDHHRKCGSPFVTGEGRRKPFSPAEIFMRLVFEVADPFISLSHRILTERGAKLGYVRVRCSNTVVKV